MNIKQLRCFCEFVNASLFVSQAARNLHISQPAMSKQLRQLEEELGVPLFVRGNNRLVSLTPVGSNVLVMARKILFTADSIRSLCRDSVSPDSGDLRIMTTHAHARFLLPKALKQFRSDYKKVRILVKHAHSHEIEAAIDAGDADIGITPKEGKRLKELIYHVCKVTPRILLVPAGHALEGSRKPALKEIAQYPIIATENVGQPNPIQAFDKYLAKPQLVLSVANIDVAKACVEQGIGIAVLPQYAFDVDRDSGLRALPISHLFEPITTVVVIRRNYPLPLYGKNFLNLLINNDGEYFRRLAAQPAA